MIADHAEGRDCARYDGHQHVGTAIRWLSMHRSAAAILADIVRASDGGADTYEVRDLVEEARRALGIGRRYSGDETRDDGSRDQ